MDVGATSPEPIIPQALVLPVALPPGLNSTLPSSSLSGSGSRRLEVASDEDEMSNAESYHSRRSHSTTGAHSRHNSSNGLNVYSYNDLLPVGSDGAHLGHVGHLGRVGHVGHVGHVNVRRSASGVFRCPNDPDDPDAQDADDHDSDTGGDGAYNSDPLYLLENGCHRHSAHLHSHGHAPLGAHAHGAHGAIPDYALEDMYHSPKDPFDGLQKQMTIMNKNLSSKLEELHGFQAIDTNVALTEIRSQLHELTKSVESCQSEVYEVKQDMINIKSEIDSVQFVKDEIDDIRDSLDRLEAEGERRKAKLLEQGLTFFLGYSIFSAVLGMLQFGYNTGVINAPESVIEKFIRFAYRQRYNGQNMTYEASTFLYAIAVAVFALGGMCGGFVGGWMANKLGRKGGLLLNNVVGVIGATAMGCSKYLESYELLIMGRFLIGVNCGLNTSLVPMYISEISPLTLRGGLGTVNQLAVTVGLLTSQILGVEGLLGTDNGWPYLLGIALFPSILQMILLPFCPESPRFLLITRQQEKEAREALKKLRNSVDIEDDIDEMRAEEMAQRAEAKITMYELICSDTLRLPLIIAIVMQLSQQLSGINAVFYYSTNLFMTTGLTETHAKYATIGIGVVMVVMTLISIPLMDRSGRRTLHLYGLGGMFVFSIFITISFLVKELVSWIWWLSVVSTLFYVVFFAVGPGSIPWMITAELFSQGPRPAAMSIAVLVNWCANFFVGIGFPTMQTSLQNYTFLPFSVFLANFWIFTYKKVPETKNKTFDEIATLFRIGHRQRSLMSCVTSISQMNSATGEHSSLIPLEKPPAADPPAATRVPEADRDPKDYPPMLSPPSPGGPCGSIGSTSSSGRSRSHSRSRSRSPQSLRSGSQLSGYSGRHHSPDRLMSRSNSERSSISGGHHHVVGPPPPQAHAATSFMRNYTDCSSKNSSTNLAK